MFTTHGIGPQVYRPVSESRKFAYPQVTAAKVARKLIEGRAMNLHLNVRTTLKLGVAVLSCFSGLAFAQLVPDLDTSFGSQGTATGSAAQVAPAGNCAGGGACRDGVPAVISGHSSSLPAMKNPWAKSRSG
jgi:hypothetical protein